MNYYNWNPLQQRMALNMSFDYWPNMPNDCNKNPTRGYWPFLIGENRVITLFQHSCFSTRFIWTAANKRVYWHMVELPSMPIDNMTSGPNSPFRDHKDRYHREPKHDGMNQNICCGITWAMTVP